MIAQGISTRAFLIDVFSPCVTYNKHNTFQWFKQRVHTLGQRYDATDYEHALSKAREYGDRIPTGLFYRASRPTYEDGEPAFKLGPLVHHKLGLTPEQGQALLREFI
jgi:2-oxoglutarate ferredoxin oxidoreductase subunit beta